MLHVFSGSIATQARSYSCFPFWTDRSKLIKDPLLSNYADKNNIIATCSSTQGTPLRTSVLKIELLHHDKHCQYMPTTKDMPATPSMWKMR